MDDIFVQHGFLSRLSYVVPLVIIYILSNNIVGHYEFVNRIILSLIAIVLIASLNSLLSAINDIYNQIDESQGGN